MPNTITAFYEFSPGIKARSSEVNTNFTTRRGTFLPMEENTATASHNSHDLGYTDHRWSTFYGGTVDLLGATSSSNLVFKNVPALTVGAAEWLIGATTLGNLAFGEFGFAGQTTTQYTKFKYQSGITAGALDLLMGATTLASWDTNGLKGKLIAPMEFTSTSAPAGTALFAVTPISNFLCDTTGSFTFGSYRFNAKGGGIVHFQMVNTNVYISASTMTGNEVVTLRVYSGLTTSALTLLASWLFSPQVWSGAESTFSAYPATILGTAATPIPALQYFHSSVTAGEVVFEVRAVGTTAFVSTASNPRFYLASTVMISEI